MNIKVRCKECGALIYQNKNKCSCGWVNTHNPNVEKDARCEFNNYGERCPLPGSMSILGNVWYCGYHVQTINDFGVAKKWLSFIINNLKSILHYRKHYSDNFNYCQECKNFEKLEKEYKNA